MAFSLAAFLGPIAAGQILEKAGIGSGFKIQIGISAALALICVPLVWLYMVSARSLHHSTITQLNSVSVLHLFSAP